MIKKKSKIWTEAELIDTFNLERKTEFDLLKKWIEVEEPTFDEFEQSFFDNLLILAKRGADFWNEETLKMRFISPLLAVMTKLEDIEQNRYEGFFDYTISATVEGIYLQTETDFILAKGVGDIAKTPYFHFQEYCFNIPPLGEQKGAIPPDPVAQLLEAFLIAQEKNKNDKPLYGAVIVGRSWQFMMMKEKEYAISSIYDITEKQDLLEVIAILRKFKSILETDLLG